MRIHVTANGKATSISVDESLVDYFGAHLVRNTPKLHTDAEVQLKKAKRNIQEFVRTSKSLPDKDLSQYVHRVILNNIMNPEYVKILEIRGPRFVANAQRSITTSFKLPPLSPEQLAAAAERKRKKSLIAEAKKQRKDREAMKQALKNSTGQ